MKLIPYMAICMSLCGCTVLWPHNEMSRDAEVSWLAIDAVDTAQTVQIAQNPRCYSESDPLAAMLYGGRHPKEGVVIAVNGLLAIGHSYISAMLDRKVAAEREDGAWDWLRRTWEVFSIGLSTASVVHNAEVWGISPGHSICHESSNSG